MGEMAKLAEEWMEDFERKLGAMTVPLGTTHPFRFCREDWRRGVVSRLGDEVRIVAVEARRQGRGALRRLVDGIKSAGLVPVIVCPVGRFMPAILRHWGWKKTFRFVEGENVEEWRP